MVSMFDTLFLVFSGEGKIVAWRLAKNTSFGNIESLLLHLAERSKRQNVTIKHIYIDNCCHWRNKLNTVFGEHVEVHLDLFYAVQRLVKKIPKRHPHAHHCMAEFRLVFRQACDHGEKRNLPTPELEEMLQNLDVFVNRWENVQGNGKRILCGEALHEIDNLKVHIRKGCISGISPGCGTNRNEAFHSNIKSFFHRSRIEILLAHLCTQRQRV